MTFWFSSQNDSDDDQQTGTVTVAQIELVPPRMYKVLMHNDDYTTMEFVIHILLKFFGKSVSEANAIMMQVHVEGKASCGVYTAEVAESKVVKVISYSREQGHPLVCSFEPC